MVTTIRLDALLQEAHPAVPSRNLVTRPTGAKIRSCIEREIASRGARVTVLDFSDLDLVDLSCADEVVAKLLQRMDTSGERFVVLTGVTEDQAEAIDHVLAHHGLGVQATFRESPRPRLLGHFGEDSRRAFDLLLDLGGAAPDHLSERLGWRIDRAIDALQVLCLLGVVAGADGLYRPLLLGA
jgi:hypothetical protein